MKIWMDGRFIDAGNAKIPVSDRGFLYGDSVFETMRAYAGSVFRMDDHIGRLFGALKLLRMKYGRSKDELRHAVGKSLEVNRLKSAYVRLTVTRGDGDIRLGSEYGFKPRTIITLREFEGYPESLYRRGISARIASTRQNEFSALAGVKSSNLLNYIMARFEAGSDGFDDAILLNTSGDAAEGSSSNIFIVKNGALFTPSPDSGVLPGVTRRVVAQIAARLRISVRERRISPAELPRADEIFFTNSLAEILPVTRIGSRKVGKGSPGPITKLLHISYQKQVIKEVLF